MRRFLGMVALTVFVAISSGFTGIGIRHALAADFDTSGLTQTQISELQLEAHQKADANKTQQGPSETLQQVSKYVELGQSIGAGLASTAKEMGIAVNDFANTPIGKLATVIIVFKLIGLQVISFVVGFLWFLTMVPLWFYIFRRICLVSARVEETSTDVAGRGTKIRRWEYLDSTDDRDETIVGYRVIMFIVLAVIVIAGFVVMF